MTTVFTTSVGETEAVASRLGSATEQGDVIGLVGELGAGKTAFVRGLGAGLGVAGGEVVSPTFTMVAEYRGRMPLFHVDLYRLDPEGVDLLMLREIICGPGVTAIEWFDRLPASALDDYLLVRIDYAESGRRLRFEAHGKRAEVLVQTLTGNA